MFELHSAAVAHASAPLNVMMNIGMKESRERTAQIKDIDVDTFGRFCEFLYTGDYAGEPPGVREESSVQFGEVDFSGDNPETERKRDTVPTGQSGMTLWSNFWSQKYEYAVPRRPPPDRANISPDEDYTPVFLSHARLYVLGDTYLVRLLCDLALHKLHHCLTEYELARGRPGDIVNLIRYAYANTRGLGTEPLRTLVAQYAAKEVGDLSGTPEFDALMKEEGDHSKDILSLVVQKLKRQTSQLPMTEQWRV